MRRIGIGLTYVVLLLYYVTEGNAQVVIYSTSKTDCKEVINLRPGFLYFIPPFTMHRYVCEGHFAHYYIHILENSSDDYCFLAEYDFPREVKAETMDLYMFEMLCDKNHLLRLQDVNPDNYDNHHILMQNIRLTQQRPLWSKAESKGVLYILISKFFRGAKSKTELREKRIMQAMAYIRKNIGLPIKIRDIAATINVSKDHFIRLFNKETGETPTSFICRQKIERAERMLITTDMSVKCIAHALGFDDASYFNRIFKKNVGVTPQQYRKNSL